MTNQLVDKKRIEAAVREILLAVGEDPDREGLVETPERVARMYEEIFSGLNDDPKRHLKVFTDTQHDEMVLVRDIPLYSVCEHHLLPFIGKANIAYIPGAETCWGFPSLRGLWTALPAALSCRSGLLPRSQTS